MTEAIQALRADPNVLYVERDYMMSLTAVPNDPRFDELWGMHNTGQSVNGTTGTPGADARVLEAWDFLESQGLPMGDPNFKIAIIDTGVDYTHPDLAANIWTNPGESGPDNQNPPQPKETNGIDDDGNGYVDDVHGYDFFADHGDPMDVNGHGTHVAGTIGAEGNNNVGVVGVNWRCQIVALKGGDTGIFISASIEALQYIVDNDIKVSNNSYGLYDLFFQSWRDAIEATQANGHIFVAAAGNGVPGTGLGFDVDEFSRHYPSSFDLPNIISVAAVDQNDGKAQFSNFGPRSVDLGAPGVNVLSTVPPAVLGVDYVYAAGTSMATPHVVGVVALTWGSFPSLSWEQVCDRVLLTTRPVASMAGRTVTGGVLNTLGAVGDCNENNVLDSEEIASGSSLDCNANTVPDECEADCNGNGIVDGCDVSSGASADCNGNEVPDECEDCNNNQMADECDLTTAFSDVATISPIGYGAEHVFVFSAPPLPVGDVTLTFEAVADLDATDEFIDVSIVAASNLPYTTQLYVVSGLDCGASAVQIVVPANVFFGVQYGNQDIEIEVSPSSPVDSGACGGSSSLTVTIDYAIHDDEKDCNLNDVPDECEPGGLVDCNLNGEIDLCDIYTMSSTDCNENAVPDECDISAGGSEDCTANGVPDECEMDCNENGVADSCDIAADPSLDMDGDGVLDTCALGVTLIPIDSSGAHTITGRQITMIQGDRVTLEVNISGWDPDRDGSPRLSVYQVTIDESGFNGGSSGSLGAAQISCQVNEDCVGSCLGNGFCDLPSVMFFDETHPNYVFAGLDTFGASGTANLFVGVLASPFTSNGVAESSGPRYAATLILDASLDATGSFFVGFVDPPDETFFGDPDLVPIPVPGVNAAEIIVQVDCNQNGLLDGDDIASGASDDCDDNGVPDECEPPQPDCNANQIADGCDITEGTSEDCDEDGVPDECQLVGNDCNANGILDSCDLVSETSEDCDGNTIPDECDIAACVATDPDCDDCNVNGIPDSCDIDSETSEDDDGDGVPNECECKSVVAPSPESHGNCTTDLDCTGGVSCIDSVCYPAKSRYISFGPNNSGEVVAFFIGDPPVAGSCSMTGAACASDIECPNVCMSSGAPCGKFGCAPGDFCMSQFCLGGSPGSGSWVDTPNGNSASLVVSAPVYRIWSEPVVHVGDCEIVPDETYDLYAVHLGCDTEDGASYAGPLTLTTTIWGDTVGFYDGQAWTPPNGILNINDLTAVIQGFQQVPTAPPVPWVDLAEEVPNWVINANDMWAQGQAAQGNPYPYSDPDQCP